MPAPPFDLRRKIVAAPLDPLSRLRQSGLVAQIPGALPIADQLTVGDALLATPWPIIAITVQDANALAAVTQLRQRFGRHMLIGAQIIDASPGATLSQLRAALAADAQFVITSATADSVLIRLCQQRHVLYVPTVTTQDEAEDAAVMGCQAVRCRMLVGSTLETVQTLSTMLPVLVEGDFTEDTLADLAQAKTLAALITPPHLPPDWSMPRFITAARSLRAAWDRAF